MVLTVTWDNIHTETYKGFTLRFDVAPEDMDPAASFSEPEDIAAVRDGTWLWFQVRCTAELCGVVLGSAYLGGCAYAEYGDFLMPDGYAADMREEVVREAHAKLAELRAKVPPAGWVIAEPAPGDDFDADPNAYDAKTAVMKPHGDPLREVPRAFDWYTPDGFAAVFSTDEEGAEDERVADFYGPNAEARAIAYAAFLNEAPAS